MKVRVHVFIYGRVQGVFFRSETCREARRRKLKGWVRNLADGSVEVMAEGEREDIERLVEFCKRGPRGARVTKTKTTFKPYIGEFTDFRINW
ncbi:MAG: acylphosphatase [Candidatus Bathyarchaeota archaeon]|nr:MAG: acylphosphatase [Candidatus Bathyarchaeota archaeon]